MEHWWYGTDRETEVHGKKHVPVPLCRRGRVVLEKITVPQLVKKFPSFDETIMFLTEFKKARHSPFS